MRQKAAERQPDLDRVDTLLARPQHRTAQDAHRQVDDDALVAWNDIGTLVEVVRADAMPIGSGHRVTGRLLNFASGLVLEVGDGGVWALDAGESAGELLGLRVTVERTRSDSDRLDIEWIGPA